MSFILAGDSTVYYEEYGAGETLVLIPGLLGTIESDWRRFIPEFARRMHVVAIDLRGHGRTNNPRQELTLELIEQDLLHIVCNTLELQRPYFCTHGLASQLLLEFCIHHPESVGGLLLHAPIFVHETTDARIQVQGVLDSCNRDEIRRRHAALENDESLRSFLGLVTGLVEEFPRGHLLETLQTLSVPVLLTCGESMPSDIIDGYRQYAAEHPHIALEILPSSAAALSTLQKLPFINVAAAFVDRTAGKTT